MGKSKEFKWGRRRRRREIGENRAGWTATTYGVDRRGYNNRRRFDLVDQLDEVDVFAVAP